MFLKKKNLLLFLILILILSCTGSYQDQVIDLDTEGRDFKIEITKMSDFEGDSLLELKDYPLQTYQDTISLKGIAYDKVGIRSIYVKNNNRVLISLGNSSHWDTEIELNDGINNICMVAQNTSGVVKEDCQTVYKSLSHLTSSYPSNYIFGGCVSYQDKLYCTGGDGDNLNKLRIMQNGTWSDGPDMPEERHSFTILLINDKIYVLGGIDPSNMPTLIPQNNMVFNITSNTWSTISKLNQARALPTAVYLQGKIYVFGGVTVDLSRNILNTIEVYEAGAWQNSPVTLNHDRFGALSIVYNNQVYLFGGYGLDENVHENVIVKEVERFDPLQGNCDVIQNADMLYPRVIAAGGLIQDQYVYIVGGVGEGLKYIQRYNLIANTWEATGTLDFYLFAGSGYSVSDNTLYIIGGKNMGTDSIGKDVYRMSFD